MPFLHLCFYPKIYRYWNIQILTVQILFSLQNRGFHWRMSVCAHVCAWIYVCVSLHLALICPHVLSSLSLLSRWFPSYIQIVTPLLCLLNFIQAPWKRGGCPNYLLNTQNCRCQVGHLLSYTEENLSFSAVCELRNNFSREAKSLGYNSKSSKCLDPQDMWFSSQWQSILPIS